MVTISDIAQKAGSSVTTVSRVLNNKSKKYRISEQTEKRIRKAAKEMNYKPNQLARGLRLRKTHSIGLVLPDISNPFFAYVTRSIQTTAHQMGYSLVVCDTDETLSMEVAHIEFLRSKGVDGMIVMPVGVELSHLELLIAEGMPLVLVDRCFDALKVDSVVVDNYLGAYDAVEHLIRHGHRRIAFVQGIINTYSNTGRLQGYKDALAKYGIAIDPGLIVGNGYRKETGYVETKLLLKRAERPSAIFATSDLITLGVLEAIEEEGAVVPDDISLVAFDDFDFAPYLKCPLTTVAQPKEHMGELAVKLLVDQIKGLRQGAQQRMLLKPTLIQRASVRDLPPSAMQAAAGFD